MKLFELTGIKKYYNKSEYQIERLLQKFGIRFIAGGKYGKIFASPKWDYVVKMFKNDPYYLGFVNYAIKHPNKHYPKFIRKPLQMHSFAKRNKTASPKFWIVKIEKLQELSKEKAAFVMDHLERAEQAWYNKNHNPQSYEQDWTYMWVPDSGIGGGERQRMTWKQIFEMYPWLETLAEAWYNIFNNVEEGSPDIHAKNFMQRADGTIVIIDPLWQGSNPYADYQAALDRETFNYDDEYEEPQVQGPAYLHKKQQAAIEATRSFAKQMAPSDDFDADIPF